MYVYIYIYNTHIVKSLTLAVPCSGRQHSDCLSCVSVLRLPLAPVLHVFISSNNNNNNDNTTTNNNNNYYMYCYDYYY